MKLLKQMKCNYKFDENGNYLFDNVNAGDYLVVVSDVNDVLDGLNLTGGEDPLPVQLEDGEVFLDADFGYAAGMTFEGF